VEPGGELTKWNDLKVLFGTASLEPQCFQNSAAIAPVNIIQFQMCSGQNYGLSLPVWELLQLVGDFNDCSWARLQFALDNQRFIHLVYLRAEVIPNRSLLSCTPLLDVVTGRGSYTRFRSRELVGLPPLEWASRPRIFIQRDQSD
jgi:hypothetical protein